MNTMARVSYIKLLCIFNAQVPAFTNHWPVDEVELPTYSDLWDLRFFHLERFFLFAPGLVPGG